MPFTTMAASAALLVGTLVAPGGPAARADADVSVDVASVVSDAGWTLSAQLPDGAITHYVDHVRVWPYEANFAAMGLARATGVSGNAAYANGAWRWLAWYQGHQDARGFVTDYTVAPDGSLASTGDMDSTDAYAGTFLLAARRTYKAAPDRTRLGALKPGLVAAVAAIEATQDSDGLTWAKPAWRVKYLMDQSEAYAGLKAASELAATLGDLALQQRATADAQRLATGVGRLWNPAMGAYDWAVHDTGARQAANWTVFYPDAQQQVWVVAFGLATGTRAKSLVATFDRTQPNWDQPTATATYDSGPKAVGYWPVTGWAYAQVGRTARSATASATMRAAALGVQRAWPFTTGNGGQLLQLESADLQILAR